MIYMRLVRLLTAGKSFVGSGSDAPRYKETDPRSMPKFKPKKNPFRKTQEKTENRNTPSPSGSTAGTPAGRPSSRPVTVQAATRKQGWLKRVGSWFAPRKKQPKPAVPQFTKAPLQGELSLDNVKVVRNDLSDADLEVVPAKPAPAKPKEAAPAQPRVEVGSEVAAGKS
jgi:hypothetical protein